MRSEDLANWINGLSNAQALCVLGMVILLGIIGLVFLDSIGGGERDSQSTTVPGESNFPLRFPKYSRIKKDPD